MRLPWHPPPATSNRPIRSVHHDTSGTIITDLATNSTTTPFFGQIRAALLLNIRQRASMAADPSSYRLVHTLLRRPNSLGRPRSSGAWPTRPDDAAAGGHPERTTSSSGQRRH
ncbi:hypothetical protein ACLOJK_018861 [Asimina triloba]